MKDFYILFSEELKKMYNAERAILKALPSLQHSSSSKKLKKALALHTKETVKQVRRLEEIASEFDEKLVIKENASIKHILQDAKKSIQNCHDPMTRDAAIIMSLQKLKHYEMACYGSLKAFAKHFKLSHIVELLETSSKEEGFIDKKLTEIAEGGFFDAGVNTKAYKKCA